MHPWYMADGQPDHEAAPGIAPVEHDVAVLMELDVDGEVFELRPDEFAGTHYTWVNGPNPGYGFAVSPTNAAVEEHRQKIRDFLAVIDPMTGYLREH